MRVMMRGEGGRMISCKCWLLYIWVAGFVRRLGGCKVGEWSIQQGWLGWVLGVCVKRVGCSFKNKWHACSSLFLCFLFGILLHSDGVCWLVI